MAEVNLEKTVHVGGKVFFKGKAIVSDQDKILIDAELERLKALEEQQQAEQSEEDETPKKKTKTEK